MGPSVEGRTFLRCSRTVSCTRSSPIESAGLDLTTQPPPGLACEYESGTFRIFGVAYGRVATDTRQLDALIRRLLAACALDPRSLAEIRNHAYLSTWSGGDGLWL
jgi:hypothetical protein